MLDSVGILQKLNGLNQIGIINEHVKSVLRPSNIGHGQEVFHFDV